MKFEEVYPAYKEGKTIKCNVHKFNQEEPTVIRTELLDSEDWRICSKIEEYMDILHDVICVDFRQFESHDTLELNLIEIMENWDVDTELSKEHELKEITWYIPRKTKIHFVSNLHLFAGDILTLNEDGVMTLFTRHQYKHREHVNNIELIYLTGEYE